MSTHKAWRLHSYGGPETLQLDDVEIPQPIGTEVLVAIHAVGMNPFDWKVREGYLKEVMPLPLPQILGSDFAGTVAATGERASKFKVGDRVMAISTSMGAYAEHVVIEENILARIPDALSDIEAATLPMPATTAWEALYKAGEVKPGFKIMINGASGICGAFAVQFAKSAGATVVGVASAKNKEYVMELGADNFVDYNSERFEDKVKDVDLVLDFAIVGGLQNGTQRAFKVLKPNAAVVSAADPSIYGPGAIPDGYRGFFFQTTPEATTLDAVAQELADKKLSSKIGQVFNRGDLVKAMEINKTGGTTGRLMVDFTKA